MSVNAAELFRLWHMPQRVMPAVKIAEHLGVGLSTLYALARKHKLPRRPKLPQEELDVPTQQEIAERARAIRDAWPEGEAERRFVGATSKRWVLPSYAYDGRECAFVGTAMDF